MDDRHDDEQKESDVRARCRASIAAWDSLSAHGRMEALGAMMAWMGEGMSMAPSAGADRIKESMAISGFALSKACSAVWEWSQSDPSAGERFGLEQSWSVDSRAEAILAGWAQMGAMVGRAERLPLMIEVIDDPDAGAHGRLRHDPLWMGPWPSERSKATAQLALDNLLVFVDWEDYEAGMLKGADLERVISAELPGLMISAIETEGCHWSRTAALLSQARERADFQSALPQAKHQAQAPRI
jgi:hypothetical protein